MSAAERDSALRRGEARLEKELARLHRRLDDRVAAVIRELEEGVDRPLREALTRAAAAHQALLRETGLDALVHPVAAEDPPAPGGGPGPEDHAGPEEDTGTGEQTGEEVAATAGDDADAEDDPTAEGDPVEDGSAPEPETPVPPLPSWSALRDYRRGLGRRVLEPLDEALARLRPASAVEEPWTRFQERLNHLHRGCPVQVERPEPEGLYRPATGDGLLTVTGKLAVRSARGLGKAVAAPFRGLARVAGAPPAPRSLPPQRVPVHALARDRLRGPDPDTWANLGEELWRHHAVPLARLESALATFNRAWYPMEAARQEPGDILDETVAARVNHILSQAAEPPDESGGGDAPPDPGEAVAGEGEIPADEEVDEASAGGDEKSPSEEAIEAADATETDAEAADPDADPAVQEASDAQETPAEDDGKPVRTLIETIQALEAALSRAADHPPPEEIFQRIRAAASETWDGFVDAVDRSDSFHARGGEARRDRGFRRAAARFESRGRRWHPWFAGARARVHFSLLLVLLRNHWDDAHAELVNGVGRQGLVDLADQWLEARDHLLALHREALASDDLTPANIREHPLEVAEVLSRWLEIATTELREHLVEPMDRHEAVEVIGRIADDASESLSRIASRLPESVEFNLPQSDPERVVTGVPRRTVTLRSLVSETLDAFRVEAIRTSPAPLVAILEQAAAKCTEIPRVVEYNLTAARDELLSEAGETGEEDGPDGNATRPAAPTREEEASDADEDGDEVVPWEEEVEELTLQGLARTAQGVETLLSLFGPAWNRFVDTVHETLPPTFTELHRRAVAEGMVREQLHGLRAFFRRKGRLGWTEVRAWAAKVDQWLEKRWRALRPRLRALLRLGRMAVGASTAGGDEERALEVLRTIPELVAPLPLVYRRLFSFQPVSDATLLAGREEELEWFGDRYAGWQADRPAPCLVVAPPGAGVTSLFNVLDSGLLRDAETARFEFNARVGEEAELVSVLAEGLAVDDAPGSLRELGRRIMAQDPSTGPRTILLEGLEYLQFRGPGGGRILTELLALQAHTASRVFWASSICEAAWSLVRVRSRVSASLVSVLELEPLTRAQIESSILQRHRRSGLPVVFLAPNDLNPLKARSLKRARTREERQAILQEDFFDRIYRLSRGSPAMADVLWLRSLDLEAQEGQAQIRSCRPVRFAFLETLTPEMDFALMALLEHGSLTLDECRRVLHLPEHQMTGIFEALRTRMLLQHVVDEHMIPRPVEELEADASYRIPQILGMAVAERLRGLNILH